jgi:adenosylcobinamide-GDP ribazoletransferase
MLARSMLFFPVVGLLIGGIEALVFWGMHNFLSPSLIALFLILIPIILTGALHIEGFADMMDGFAGGHNKNEILQVMRDSRIGAIGAISVTILILAKFVLIKELIVEHIFGSTLPVERILLVIFCLSRWAMVISAGMSRYARNSRIGRAFTELVDVRIVCLASIIPIVSAIILFKLCGLIWLSITLLLSFLVSRIASHKVGGITGDILGGVNEIVEIVLLLSMIILIR